MSPISSRKRVPPFACSNFPFLLAAAPVKAPFSWPKSSDSMSSVGNAAQFTATNAPPLRAVLRSCSSRATSSFPVPDSPRTSTVASVSATFSIIARTRFIASELPSKAPRCEVSISILRRSERFSRRSRIVSKAFLTTSRRSSSSKGLEM